MDLLVVRHLSKTYRDFALKDITFTLPAGYIMGYVGKNGAGKTTTLNAICRLIRPDGGESLIGGVAFDRDPVTYRERIGYIGDSSYFPQNLTLKDIRRILKDFYPSFRRETFEEYIEKWNLPPEKKLKDYSRGTKVKLMFAAALSRETQLMILDEATNGLDPVMRRQILTLLQDYIADGNRSVLFSTHIMEDLSDIADYLFLIDEGKKVLMEEKDALLERYLLVKGGPGELTDQLSARLIGVHRHEFGFSGLFDTSSGETLPRELSCETPSIDQIVVHLIERG